MSNLPPLFQRTYPSGKRGGSWHTRIGKTVVNLKCRALKVAEARRLEAVAGRRKFEYEDNAPEPAASASAPSPGEPARMTMTPEPAPPPITSDVPDDTSWVSDVGGAASAGGPSPETPAAESGDGAAGAASSTTGGASGTTPPQGQPVPPELLKSIMMVAVDVQLGLQAWGIELASRKRKIAAEVPADHPVREVAATLWAQQLPLWFPDLGSIPPWVQAVAAVGSLMVYQARNATDAPPKDDKKPRADLPRVSVVP